MGKVIVIGGGTYSKVACHLSLCAPAFGGTAKKIHAMFQDNGTLESTLLLTKMADPSSAIISNDDLVNALIPVLADMEVKAIIMNAALCDFEAENDTGEERLSSQKEYTLTLRGVTGKLIAQIKEARPDIWVVGFKTTAGASPAEQAAKAFNQIATTGVETVLANDTITRKNILVHSNLLVQEGHREWLLQQLMETVVIGTNIRGWGLEEK